MNPSETRSELLARRRRVEEIFDQVADLPAEGRASQLALACAGDPSLRDEVETLLRHDLAARGDLEALVAVAANEAGGAGSAEERAGLRIGPWRLVREIGRGGMGSVWLGERVAGDFQQRVAVKLIRPGLEKSEHLVHRFEAERRILAGLVHPSIARLYDGGAGPGDRPYLVMEYVEGKPLTEAAAELPVARRLELFLAVADAVAYAHRNLVVHRDLKPGNILVAEGGTPKLLDFGIAKLIDPTMDITQTMAGALAFSPEYASPEQVMGQPITTATDVYGLGAVLYELLTGKKAQPVAGPTPVAIYQAVFESSRPRASAAAPAALRQELAGDLDAIIEKALRLEPEARYSSAAELAEDLRRHLAAKPVRARQETWAYRSSLFVRRHRAAVIAALLIGLSLLGGLVGTIWQMKEKEKEAKLAQRRFEQVRGLATRFLFEFDRAIAKIPGTTEARRLVVQTGAEHLDTLARDTSGDAALQLELGQAYIKLARVQGSMDSSNLGQRSEAIASIDKGLALGEALAKSGAGDSPDTLELMGTLHLERAIVFASQGRDQETLAEIEKGLALANRLLPTTVDSHRRLRSSLLLRMADLQLGRGDPRAARRALELALVDPMKDIASTLARLGLAAREEGDFEGALRYFERAAEVVINAADRCRLDADIARTLFYGEWPGLGRRAGAAEHAEAAISCGDELLALDRKDVRSHLVLLQALADGAWSIAEERRAIVVADRALATIANLESLAPEALEAEIEAAMVGVAKASALARIGRSAEAAELLRKALPVLDAAPGSSDPRPPDAHWLGLVIEAELLGREGRAAEAKATFRTAAELAAVNQQRQPARPMRRFFHARGNEGLARLLARGDAADRDEARRLVAETEAAWSEWRQENLTAAYAQARLAALEELRRELGASGE